MPLVYGKRNEFDNKTFGIKKNPMAFCEFLLKPKRAPVYIFGEIFLVEHHLVWAIFLLDIFREQF